MIFSLLILGPPTASPSHQTALRFATAALQNGHQIYRVFFFDEAAAIGNQLRVVPQDEPNVTEQWQQLGREHQLDLVVCVSSALKRGVLDDTEAQRYEKSAANLPGEFDISGLGQLVDASTHSDRVITFGA